MTDRFLPRKPVVLQRDSFVVSTNDPSSSGVKVYTPKVAQQHMPPPFVEPTPAVTPVPRRGTIPTTPQQQLPLKPLVSLRR